MATYYWKGGGGNNLWSNASNWTTASAGTTAALTTPVGIDDVIFDGLGTNGNTDSNINNAFTIQSLNITSGYTAAMSHSAALTISGSLTLGANYTISGSSGITIVSQSTLTSNGKICPIALTFSNSFTRSIFDNFQVGGLTTISGNTTFNTASLANPSASLILNGGLTANATLSGNAKIILAGGTWSSTVGQAIENNMDISGSITLSNNPRYGSATAANTAPTLRWISGSITTGSAAFALMSSTIDTEPIIWPNTTFPLNNEIIRLSSSLNIGGLITVSSTTTLNTASAANPSASLNVRGGITTSATLSGNAKVVLIGGTWGGGTAGLANNTDISGSIALSNVASAGWGGVATNVLRYITGSVSTGSVGLFTMAGGGIFDVEPVTWGKFFFQQAGTFLLSSSLNVNELTTVTSATTLNTASAANPSASLNVRGGITVNANLSGNAKVVLIRGSWTGNAAGSTIANNTDISGSITLNGTNTGYGGTAANVLRYVSGSVTTAGSAFNVRGSCTLDVEPITFNRAIVDITQNMTVTLSSSVYVSQSTEFSFAGIGAIFNKASSNPTASWYTRGMTLFGANASGGPSGAGNAKFVLTGGSLGTTGRTLTASHDIDISGSIQVSGTISFGSSRSPTMTWVSGTVQAENSTISTNNQTIIFNTPDITWGSLSLTNSTLNSVSRVIIGQTFSLNNAATCTGTGGWTARDVSYSNAGTALSFTLEPNVQYNILNSLISNGGRTGATITFTSANAITRSILTLSPDATCNTNSNFTRIDASLGRPIRTFNGTITDCVNIEQLTDIITSAGSFVATI